MSEHQIYFNPQSWHFERLDATRVGICIGSFAPLYLKLSNFFLINGIGKKIASFQKKVGILRSTVSQATKTIHYVVKKQTKGHLVWFST
jgi:hypothetical protein